jgi:hypothetical protein
MPGTPDPSRHAFLALIQGLERRIAQLETWIRGQPRAVNVTTAVRDAMSEPGAQYPPQPGRLIYVTDAAATEHFQGWDGSTWRVLG